MEDGRIMCNSCSEDIIGFRYYSLSCVNYNMCSTCERKSRKSELFIRLFEPLYDTDSSEQFRNEEFLREIMRFNLSHYNKEPLKGIYHYVNCNGCRQEIINIRYKCIDCENVDFCGYCKDTDFTHRRHLLVRIVHPLHLKADTEVFVNKIMDFRKSRDDENFNRIQSPEGPDVSEQCEHKYVLCNGCDELIEGFIFKCIDCPDFYLCSNCEPSNWHSGHLVIRHEEPLDEYAQSILKRVISIRLSPNYEDFIDVDSEEHLECSDFSESKIHEGIMCHECSGSCSGFRYKCIQCPDYDLCSNCQIHDNHEKHFFIRIAEPLTTDVANRKFIEKVMVIGPPPNEDTNCSENDDSQYNSEQNESADEQNDDTLNADAESDDSWTTINEADEDINNTGLSDDVYDDQQKPSTSRKPNNKPNDEERATVQNCTICYDRPSNVTLLDCGHLCICFQCLSAFMNQFTQCPICKTDITKPPCRVFY